jgi:ATP-dependent Clp protease adaptor protein ClpS
MDQKIISRSSGFNWGKATVDALNSLGKLAPECKTILFNCYCHSFDEATNQISKATGCSHDTAMMLAHTAEKEGHAVIFEGPEDECERVATVMREIELSACKPVVWKSGG